MDKIVITQEQVKEVYGSRFVKVYDLQYEQGKHYFDATRREKEELAAVKTDEQFRKMLPDAVSCVLIVRVEGQEPRLCLTKEYRFPAGRFLLSVPAGLLDEEDKQKDDPLLSAVERELWEETGIRLEPQDEVKRISPLVFSTPGMTDESNALIRVVLNRTKLPQLTQAGAVGGECFDGFRLVTKEEAEKILRDGVDEEGFFYSVYTWMALMCFVTSFWK